MKKIKFLLALVLVVFITGCCDNKAAIEFKNEYESLNGKLNSHGKEHRTISVDKDNPYVKITQKEIVEKIENNEKF